MAHPDSETVPLDFDASTPILLLHLGHQHIILVLPQGLYPQVLFLKVLPPPVPTSGDHSLDILCLVAYYYPLSSLKLPAAEEVALRVDGQPSSHRNWCSTWQSSFGGATGRWNNVEVVRQARCWHLGRSDERVERLPECQRPWKSVSTCLQTVEEAVWSHLGGVCDCCGDRAGIRLSKSCQHELLVGLRNVACLECVGKVANPFAWGTCRSGLVSWHGLCSWICASLNVYFICLCARLVSDEAKVR